MSLERITQPQAQDNFSYVMTFENLTPGSMQNGNFLIQADADFAIVNQCQKTLSNTPAASDSESDELIPEVVIMITDTGSSRQIYSGQVPISTQFGNGRLPFILPIPKYLFANSTLQIQVTNLSTTKTYRRIDLAFNGIKLYK